MRSGHVAILCFKLEKSSMFLTSFNAILEVYGESSGKNHCTEETRRSAVQLRCDMLFWASKNGTARSCQLVFNS